MSKCTFTGLPTENKWKNIPVHPDIIDLAREMVEDTSCPATTMRQAFALLTSQLNKDIKVRNELNQVQGVK